MKKHIYFYFHVIKCKIHIIKSDVFLFRSLGLVIFIISAHVHDSFAKHVSLFIYTTNNINDIYK